jgi:hypothetical protein
MSEDQILPVQAVGLNLRRGTPNYGTCHSQRSSGTTDALAHLSQWRERDRKGGRRERGWGREREKLYFGI